MHQTRGSAYPSYSLLTIGTYHVDSPRREVALLDVLEQELNADVGVVARHLARLRVGVRLAAAVLANVDLHVVELAVFVDELVRVAGIAVHVVVPVGMPTVGEQNHNLVDRLGVEREVVLGGTLAFHGLMT